MESNLWWGKSSCISYFSTFLRSSNMKIISLLSFFLLFLLFNPAHYPFFWRFFFHPYSLNVDDKPNCYGLPGGGLMSLIESNPRSTTKKVMWSIVLNDFKYPQSSLSVPFFCSIILICVALTSTLEAVESWLSLISSLSLLFSLIKYAKHFVHFLHPHRERMKSFQKC